MERTNDKMRTGGLDVFRIVAAFLVVAIHTGPFQGISDAAEEYVMYGVCRLAVPFFFMVTGFFVLNDPLKRKRAMRHLLALYVFSILLYLPVQIYSGNLPHSVGGVLKQVFFDGTFYHLWYLPAVILGLCVAAGLIQRLGMQKAGIVAAVLYLAGIFGDSYYGAVEQAAPLKAVYEAVFAVSSYTRNGIFFAPVFLILGAALASNETIITKWGSVAGFLLSMAAMLAEVYLTSSLGWQKHNSMYLFLPLAAFFLFKILEELPLHQHPRCRSVSMWIYLLHPLCIIVVRAVAGALGKKQWLLEHTFLFYVLVCIGAAAAAEVFAMLQAIVSRKRRRFGGSLGKEQGVD